MTLLSQIFYHDPQTFRHSLRVGGMMYQFGQYQNLPVAYCRTLYTIGLYHDIGKLQIPREILTKSGKLTEQEFEEIKKHPIYGKEILDTQGHPVSISGPVLYHHENFDGSGYYGKQDKEISYESMLTRIVDSYDTILHGRIYQKSCPKPLAIEEIMRCSGTSYEPVITHSFKTFLEMRYS